MFGSWSDDGRGEQRLIFTSVDIVVGRLKANRSKYLSIIADVSWVVPVFDSRNVYWLTAANV